MSGNINQNISHQCTDNFTKGRRNNCSAIRTSQNPIAHNVVGNCTMQTITRLHLASRSTDLYRRASSQGRPTTTLRNDNRKERSFPTSQRGNNYK